MRLCTKDLNCKLFHTGPLWPGYSQLRNIFSDFWPRIFLGSQTLTSLSFGTPWATNMHSISFESPNVWAINFCIVKSVAALLRYVMLSQSNPIYKVLMCWCYIGIGQRCSSISSFDLIILQPLKYLQFSSLASDG